MRDVSKKAFQMPYGGMGRANVTPVTTDMFKGRYKVDTVNSTYSCAKQSDLKALLESLGTQATLIAYVFNELYEKGVCELKYKAITISDDEWKRTNGTYNPANEFF